MKRLLGIAIVLLGAAAGVYIGGYLMIFGGGVQFVDALQADPVDSSSAVIGAIRFGFGWMVGWIVFGVIGFIGGLLALWD